MGNVNACCMILGHGGGFDLWFNDTAFHGNIDCSVSDFGKCPNTGLFLLN